MERVVQPHPGELEGLRLEEGRQKSQQRARETTRQGRKDLSPKHPPYAGW